MFELVEIFKNSGSEITKVRERTLPFKVCRELPDENEIQQFWIRKKTVLTNHPNSINIIDDIIYYLKYIYQYLRDTNYVDTATCQFNINELEDILRLKIDRTIKI